MPVWHDSTAALQQDGRLQMVGIVQEQHPERARLFMQWQRLNWPLLVDAYDMLEVPFVPITVAIDEHGIVQRVGVSAREADAFVAEFVEAEFETPKDAPPIAGGPADLAALKLDAERSNEAIAWRRYADGVAVWSAAIDEAIAAYTHATELDAGEAIARFRLGVALRTRHDSGNRQSSDFQQAIDAWAAALAIDPNQYIYRRRIQQYGPRLDKPYPFYDWVDEARSKIAGRGETPVALGVEPMGAELAEPAKTFDAGGAMGEPDPHGKVERDEAELIHTEVTVVPPAAEPGTSVRVHVEVYPSVARQAHWNNEGGGTMFWLALPVGWQAESPLITLPNPSRPLSRENRRTEFEVLVPAGAPERIALSGYALYYVCEDESGRCLYRRQDFEIEVNVRASGGSVA